jgi:hypothetical protein
MEEVKSTIRVTNESVGMAEHPVIASVHIHIIRLKNGQVNL